MDEQTLKVHLQTIRANDFQPPAGEDPFDLVGPMLAHIGSPDSELRDDLIYMTLAHWIVLKRILTPEQVRQVLAVLLDEDHLWRRIGEQAGEAVFTRSFSILALALVLEYHRKGAFLSREELRQIKEQVLRYAAAERDLRGYLPQAGGWMHTAAHTADALNELSANASFGAQDLVEILNALRDKAAASNSVYVHAEGERFTEVVDTIVQRGELSEMQWHEWLQSFPPLLDPPTMETYYRFINVKNFMYTLYFRSQRSEWPDFLRTAILEAGTAVMKAWRI